MAYKPILKEILFVTLGPLTGHEINWKDYYYHMITKGISCLTFLLLEWLNNY